MLKPQIRYWSFSLLSLKWASILLFLFVSNRMPGQAWMPSEQQSAIHIEGFTQADGLVSQKIISVVQDNQGFLWIGTQDGLQRYDGYSFTTFVHDPNDPGSISNNTAENLFVDKNGTLWVGTWYGLNRFDLQTGTFEKFFYEPDNEKSLPANQILDIAQDCDGNLWFSTGSSGICRFNEETKEFTRYNYDPKDPSSLSYQAAAVLYVDSKCSLWIGTGTIWDQEANRGGLNRYDPHQDAFVRYEHDPQNPNSLGYNEISTLYEDQAGNFWVATWGYGLQLLDRETGLFYAPSANDKTKTVVYQM